MFHSLVVSVSSIRSEPFLIRNSSCLYLHSRLITEIDNELSRFSRCPLNGSTSYHPGQLLVSSHKLLAGPVAKPTAC
jgi:hypothetical protein